MKKIVCLLIFCFLSLTFSDSALAQSNYDYREDNIEDSIEYNDVTDFQNDILADIYGSSAKARLSSEIDFTSAVKTYNYTPKNLLDNITNDTLLLSLKNNTDYSWKVPIANRSDGCDYAVIYKLPDGNISYYTASTTNDGAKQVNYIFNQTQISDYISKIQINDVQNLYALSISQMNMDLIVIDNLGTISFIPFASRADLLAINNGSLYTSAEMSDVINNYMVTSSSNDPFSGGASLETTNNIQILYIAIPFALITIALFTGVVVMKRMKNRGEKKNETY